MDKTRVSMIFLCVRTGINKTTEAYMISACVNAQWHFSIFERTEFQLCLAFVIVLVVKSHCCFKVWLAGVTTLVLSVSELHDRVSSLLYLYPDLLTPARNLNTNPYPWVSVPAHLTLVQSNPCSHIRLTYCRNLNESHFYEAERWPATRETGQQKLPEKGFLRIVFFFPQFTVRQQPMRVSHILVPTFQPIFKV